MIKLSPPKQDVREFIRESAKHIENHDLEKRLIAAENFFISSEKRYNAAAMISQLFTFPISKTVLDVISVEEMKWLYKTKFSNPKSSCRGLYIKLRRKAKICPLCNARTVSTLDHYLPQSNFPEFVLTPINLIPACGDCNKTKLAFNAASLQEQTLHPYFDVLPDDQPWLTATVVEGEPLGVVFFATPPAHWDSDLSKRLVHHFNTLHLDDLYSAKASAEVAEFVNTAAMHHAVSGAEGLRNHLEIEAANRRAAAPHSWKPALYEGLAKSHWYISGGFKNIKSPDDEDDDC